MELLIYLEWMQGSKFPQITCNDYVTRSTVKLCWSEWSHCFWFLSAVGDWVLDLIPKYGIAKLWAVCCLCRHSLCIVRLWNVFGCFVDLIKFLWREWEHNLRAIHRTCLMFDFMFKFSLYYCFSRVLRQCGMMFEMWSLPTLNKES